MELTEIDIEEELRLIRQVFDGFDTKRTGKIPFHELPYLLEKLGKTTEAKKSLLNEATNLLDITAGELTFQDFVLLLRKHDKSLKEQPLEGPDPKVIEFLRILEEYRIKCEEEGNYMEASRANKQLDILRTQEEKRQQKAIRARQLTEKQDIQVAHSMQYHEFNRAWDRYMEDFDDMAQKYIQQMTERHATILLEFQEKLREELAKRPPKWSRELIEQRRQQAIHAKNRNYIEAQRLKMMCDRIEERERSEIEQNLSLNFARREALFRQHQQTEAQALLKRIEGRRKEHIKQRNLDCKRLLQRNRNVQAVLESKQSMECQRLFDEIKKGLNINHILSNHAKFGPMSVANGNNMMSQPQSNFTNGNGGQEGFSSSGNFSYSQAFPENNNGNNNGNYMMTNPKYDEMMMMNNNNNNKSIQQRNNVLEPINYGDFNGSGSGNQNMMQYHGFDNGNLADPSENPQFLLSSGPNYY